MLKNINKCPNKAMDQYYLFKQLPDYAHIDKINHQLKNHSYYHDNFNIWNNAQQSSNKIFKQFHKKNMEKAPQIQERQEQERIQTNELEKQRKQLLSQIRENQLSQLAQRKNERNQLQIESSQIIGTNVKENESLGECKFLQRSIQSQSNIAINGRADFLWNRMNKLSNKQLQQTVNQKIINMEEEAVEHINERIYKDEQVQQTKDDITKQNIKLIRHAFKQQVIKNHDDENVLLIRKLKNRTISHHLLSNENNSVTQKSILKSRFTQNEATQSINQNEEIDQRPATTNHVQIIQLINRQELIKNPLIHPTNNQSAKRFEQLSQPKLKKVSNMLKRNPLDRTEFKGLLVSEIDEIKQNLPTNFNRTMMENSNVIRETLSRQIIRPRSYQIKVRANNFMDSQLPPQNLLQASKDEYSSIQVQNETTNEIDSFERRNSKIQKRVGFPNSALYAITEMQSVN